MGSCRWHLGMGSSTAVKRFNELPYWSVQFPLELAGFVAFLWLMATFGPSLDDKAGDVFTDVWGRLSRRF